MKKPFLYGFHGKARWKSNKVFFCSGLMVFAYIEVGKIQLIITIASMIPFWVKCAIFVVMFILLGYSGWRIQKRVLSPSFPPPKPTIIFMAIAIAFIFALVSADRRVFFDICTSITILFLLILERKNRRKLT